MHLLPKLTEDEFDVILHCLIDRTIKEKDKDIKQEYADLLDKIVFKSEHTILTKSLKKCVMHYIYDGTQWES